MDIYDDHIPLVLIFGGSKVPLETGTPQKFHVLKHLAECRTEEEKKKNQFYSFQIATQEMLRLTTIQKMNPLTAFSC